MQLGHTNTAAVSQFGSGWMHRDGPVSLHRRSSIMRSTDLRRRCSLNVQRELGLQNSHCEWELTLRDGLLWIFFKRNC